MALPLARKSFSAARAGWTLTELLVIIAIVGVLIGLLVPAVQRVRETAARAQCASNLRQLALAVHQFTDARQQLPQGCAFPILPPTPPGNGPIGLSWQTSILPYVEQDSLWQLAWQAQQQDPMGLGWLHAEVAAKVVPVFLCPSDGRQKLVSTTAIVQGLTDYRGVAGIAVYREDGLFHSNYTVRFADVSDGLSNTLMLGERPPGPRGTYGGWYAFRSAGSICTIAQILGTGRNQWIASEAVGCDLNAPAFRPGKPDDACDVNHFWSFHPAGANFAFADGSVRLLRYTQAPIMNALATRAGGEPINGE